MIHGSFENPTKYKVDYHGAVAMLGGKDRKVVGNNRVLEVRKDEWDNEPWVGLRLHNTTIVAWQSDGSIQLHSGGYKTATTKAAMNEFLPMPWRVVQDGGDWFVMRTGEPKERWRPFRDGMNLQAPRERDHDAEAGRGNFDNPLKCSECGSPGVYKAGMCDACYGRKDNPGIDESARRRKAHSRDLVYDVFLHGKKIDSVSVGRWTGDTTDDVKKSLVNHDGYDPAIVVRNRKYIITNDNPHNLSHEQKFRRGDRVESYRGIEGVGVVVRGTDEKGRTLVKWSDHEELESPGDIGILRSRDNPIDEPRFRKEYQSVRRGLRDVIVDPQSSTERVGWSRWAQGITKRLDPDKFQTRSDNPVLRHYKTPPKYLADVGIPTQVHATQTDAAQYYHVRIRNAKKGEELQTVDWNGAIKAVVSKPDVSRKPRKGGRSDLQKLLFPKNQFTVPTIKTWLKENGFGSLK